MLVATSVISTALAIFLTISAIRKRGHESSVVHSYVKVGVPEDRLNRLAILLILGAAGFVGGLLWAPVGIAAATGIVIYFSRSPSSRISAPVTHVTLVRP
ncbi:MAG: hypothetical protein K0Q71_1207 [Thermomicrobiales bacterium]|nr:hypothetical protein [Thermomicrobiales bacterium]